MGTAAAPFVTWSESWLIGIQEVDAQHRYLVSLVNRLYTAVNEGKGRDALGEILDSLVKYTKAHFTTEEQLMETWGYPELSEHKAQHVAMAGKVLDFQAAYHAGHTGMSPEVLQFLRGWLQDHILGTDAKFVPLLRSKGIM